MESVWRNPISFPYHDAVRCCWQLGWATNWNNWFFKRWKVKGDYSKMDSHLLSNKILKTHVMCFVSVNKLKGFNYCYVKYNGNGISSNNISSMMYFLFSVLYSKSESCQGISIGFYMFSSKYRLNLLGSSTQIHQLAGKVHALFYQTQVFFL